MKGESFLRPLLEGLARHYRFDLDTPFSRLPKSVQRLLLRGSEDEKISFKVKAKGKSHLFRQRFEGVIPEIERRLQGDGEEMEEIEEFMNVAPCPDCGGGRLKKEIQSIKVGGRSMGEVTRLSVEDALEFFTRLELHPRAKRVAQGILGKTE